MTTVTLSNRQAVSEIPDPVTKPAEFALYVRAQMDTPERIAERAALDQAIAECRHRYKMERRRAIFRGVVKLAGCFFVGYVVVVIWPQSD